MITKEHLEVLERLRTTLSKAPQDLPYSYVMQCFYDADMLTDVIELCKEHCVDD